MLAFAVSRNTSYLFNIPHLTTCKYLHTGSHDSSIFTWLIGLVNVSSASLMSSVRLRILRIWGRKHHKISVLFISKHNTLMNLPSLTFQLISVRSRKISVSLIISQSMVLHILSLVFLNALSLLNGWKLVHTWMSCQFIPGPSMSIYGFNNRLSCHHLQYIE